MTDIAREVWRNSQTISFGQADSWVDDLFTRAWAKNCHAQLDWGAYRAGWYWFLVGQSVEDLRLVKKPVTLPVKGCDIGARAHENAEAFGVDLLCRPGEDGQLVVYNGHEQNISSRVRAHFALNNHGTGALGLKHFPLHGQRWQVRLFSAPCVERLPPGMRARVESLMRSKSGRCAVESAWRAVYGWPVLCKE